MKKVFLLLVCLGFLIVMLPANSMAATEADKRAAIDAGLAWLASTQQGAGYWDAGDVYYDTAATGAALLSFLDEKDNWGANAVAYQAVVDSGLNYLLSQAQVVVIGPQVAGNPDGDGNGVGVKLNPGGTNTRDSYVTGIVLPAIASSGTPNALVTVGVLASRTDGSGAGGAWTYRDVVQNTIDYFAFGQSDPATGFYRGGWRYYANQGTSDQSTTQWPVIASLYGTLMGVSTPAFVKNELDYWVKAIQYPDGGAGYTPTTRYGEMNETGALLIEQDYMGWGTGDPRVQGALNFIDQNWLWGLNSGGAYDGNFGHPYAMWAIYKGLERTIGLDDMTTITANLHADPGDVDNPNHGYNWWEDYCEWLVNSQIKVGPLDGSWAGFSAWNSYLATPWYINILAATEIPGPEPGVPEPATMLLLGSGLLGLCIFRKRLIKK